MAITPEDFRHFLYSITQNSVMPNTEATIDILTSEYTCALSHADKSEIKNISGYASILNAHTADLLRYAVYEEWGKVAFTAQIIQIIAHEIELDAKDTAEQQEANSPMPSD